MLSFVSQTATASGDEKYYLDGTQTLLYKTINWWYDCLPRNSDLLCGKPIRCENRGNVQITYNESDRVLKFTIKNGLSDLFSVLKSCEKCVGPSYLSCGWSDKKYFGDATAADIAHLNQFVFCPVDQMHALRLKRMENNIIAIVEGKIAGLMENGKIALHSGGNLMKRCKENSHDEMERFPISVKIINGPSKELMAHYQAVWAH